MKAHRASWIVHNGPIPARMHVLHRCDMPPCINPDHLFLGTQVDNNADRDRKGRGRVALGERQHLAKMNAAMVAEIRQSNGVSLAKLAAKYGVNKTTIGRIISRKTWKHV